MNAVKRKRAPQFKIDFTPVTERRLESTVRPIASVDRSSVPVKQDRMTSAEPLMPIYAIPEQIGKNPDAFGQLPLYITSIGHGHSRQL